MRQRTNALFKHESWIRKIVLTLLLLGMAAVSYWGSFQKFESVDKVSETYFTQSLQSATVAYAALRGVNAVVSVIKDSTIEVSPAGIGLSLAAGQVLDPVDDMTERASSVVVAVLVSLGIQRLGYEVSQKIALMGVAFLLCVLVVFVWLKGASSIWRLRVFKWIAMLLVLRFMLPALALASEWAHSQYFQPRQAEALETLGFITEKQTSLEHLWNDKAGQEGWWSQLKSRQAQTKGWFQTLSELSDRLEDVIGALLTLMMLWLMEWLLQVMLLPLLSIGIMIYLLRRWKYPVQNT